MLLYINNKNMIKTLRQEEKAFRMRAAQVSDSNK